MDFKWKKAEGITLIALVITIIILLILAGITIGTLLGENGIITRAVKAKEEYKIAEAREKLSLVLLDAGVEKRTNIKYNQDTFLNQFIKDNLEGSKIKGDIAIVDGYAFNLDRSVPKIGEYLGKEEELEFPDLTVTTQISDNKDSATITIVTQEKKNGISKIEVILDGDVVHTYDNYNNTKDEITENYTTDKNGTYTIKVYGKLPTTETTKVEGIISPVIYEPNGSEQYAKEFQVKVSVSEANERVKSIRYQWTSTTAEPTKESFTETVANGGTVTKDKLTGRYYLWTLLETESGATRTGKSEAFYFDNTGPTVKLTSTPVSESSFTLKAEATDAHVKTISKYEFYANGTLVDTQTTTEETASFTVTGMSMGTTNCYVKVYDGLENEGQATVSAKTKLYTWDTYSRNSSTSYSKVLASTKQVTLQRGEEPNPPTFAYLEPSFDSKTGKFSYTGLRDGYGILGTESCYYQVINASKRGGGASGTCDSYIWWEYKGVSYPYTCHEYVVQTTTKYTKGNSLNKTVSSNNRNAYPNNNYSGSIWYVYKGIY